MVRAPPGDLLHEPSSLAERCADGAFDSLLSERLGKVRVDDRRVLSGIIFVHRNGSGWCDAPREQDPAKTLGNRWKRGR